MTLLTRWEPVRELSSLQDRLNRLFRESFTSESPEEALTTTNFALPFPRVDSGNSKKWGAHLSVPFALDLDYSDARSWFKRPTN